MSKNISENIEFATTSFTTPGTIANEAVKSKITDISVAIAGDMRVLEYTCPKVTRSAIYKAMDRLGVIVTYQPNPNLPDYNHVQLRFFADYMREQIYRTLDLTDKVKLVGPKVGKKEMDLKDKVKEFHICTLRPVLLDTFRSYSSIEKLRKSILRKEDEISDLSKEVDISEKLGAFDNFKIGHAQRYLETIAKTRALKQKRYQLEDELEILKEQQNAFISEGEVVLKGACNVGAENCPIPADIIVSLDSIYDININSLLLNMKKTGATKLLASVIIPFGLIFTESYFSDELDVTFTRRYNTDKKFVGFSMVHGSDMTNGYIHSNETLIELMKSNYITICDYKEDKLVQYFYKYEIQKAIGEVCLIEFREVTINDRYTIRKQLPPKFDRYVLAYDPSKFFSAKRERSYILVEMSRLNAAISYVKRYDHKKFKETECLLTGLQAFVQSSFYSVVIAAAEIQEGGMSTDELVETIVIIALIIGTQRRRDTLSIIKNSENNSFIGGIWDYISEVAKSSYPISVFMDWLNSTKTKEYMAGFKSCSKLILESELNPVRQNLFEETFYGSINVQKIEETTRKEVIYEMHRDFDYSNPDQAERDLEEEIYQETVLYVKDEMNEVIKRRREIKPIIETNSDEKEDLEEEDSDEGTTIKVLPDEKAEESDEEFYDFIEEAPKVTDIDEEEIPDFVEDIQRHEKFLEFYDKIKDLKPLPEQHVKGFQNKKYINEMRMDAASTDASKFNLARIEKESIIEIPKERVPDLMDQFTVGGEPSKPILTRQEIKDSLDRIFKKYQSFAKDEEMDERLRLPKVKIYELAKAALVDVEGTIDNVLSRDILMVNGYSGCGKTTDMLNNWKSGCAYAVPYSQTCLAFNNDLKRKMKEVNPGMADINYDVKTFEQISAINRTGEIFNLDEAYSWDEDMIVLVLATFKYKLFKIYGDEEQTKYFTGAAAHVSTIKMEKIVPPKSVKRIYYTFRFGPRVAFFLNKFLNYPVVSLCNYDTKISINDLNDFDSKSMATNICTEKNTRDIYANFATTAVTVKSTQGQTIPAVNLILPADDFRSFCNYPENGIVGSSRCSKELNFYVDIKAKNSGATTNLLAFQENFGGQLGLVLPVETEKQDF